VVTATVLNKDYWYLLPVRCQQVLYKVVIQREGDTTRIRVMKGMVTAPRKLEIEMPMSWEKILREQNIDWEAPVDIENLGEPDERVCGIVVPEINPVSAYTRAGWRAPMESVLQLVQALEKKREALPFLYIGIRRRFDISALMRPWRWLSLCWCRNYYPNSNTVERELSDHGYLNVQHYSLIDHGRDREEVLLEDQYQSSENLLGLRGRIRDWLLRGGGFRRFSSAFMMVAQATREPVVVENICSELSREGSGITRIGGEIKPKKLVSLPLPRKAILYIGDAQATRAIIVVSRMRQVEERRAREARMLVRLEEQGLTGIVQSPRYLGSGDWEGAKFFVQEAKPGTAIDVNQRGLPVIQQRAFELIHAFHVKTKKPVQISEENYHDIVGWILETGLEKYAGVREIGNTLRHLDALIKNHLLEKTVQLSWMHGDYKIENMMVDPETRQIEGIIDWEHARETGLPAIDIWYLVVYNRFLVEHKNMFDLVEHMCLEGDTNPEERRVLDIHNRAFDYDALLERIMRSLFVLHHVCCRMTYDLAIPEFRQGVGSIIDNTRCYLGESN